MAGITRIPILLLTGFLGSGKTTLLRSLLRGSDAADTAVIVNEFGEVGLDHHLLLGASETVMVLENGCVCCSVRNDLEASLDELFGLRLRREIPRFSRVVIETTGLARPAGVLATIAPDSFVAERFVWQSIVATIDGVSGLETIERHAEALAQATGADRLIVTKTDLMSAAAIDGVEQRLHLLNPAAPILSAANGALPASLDDLIAPMRSDEELRRLDPNPETAPARTDAIASCWLRLAAPPHRAAFAAAFAVFVGRYGANILRAKGLLHFAGEAALSVVQYVSGSSLAIEAPHFAPGPNRQAGLVVFTTGLDPCDIAGMLSSAGLALADTPHAHHHHPGGAHTAHD